jgi:hypothetical protein
MDGYLSSSLAYNMMMMVFDVELDGLGLGAVCGYFIIQGVKA